MSSDWLTIRIRPNQNGDGFIAVPTWLGPQQVVGVSDRDAIAEGKTEEECEAAAREWLEQTPILPGSQH